MTELVDVPVRPAGLNYVGGVWCTAAAGETYTKVNPMRPPQPVGEFALSSEADAHAAVAAAQTAFADWAALPMARPGAHLDFAAESPAQRAARGARDMSTAKRTP